MEDMRLNATPVRTSRNFGINDVVIKDLVIPTSLEAFSNLTVINKTKNIKVEENAKLEKCELTFGVNLEQEEVNSMIKVTANSSEENEKVLLSFDVSKDLVDYIEIDAKENANATVIIRYASKEEVEVFNNSKIIVNAKANSNVKVVVLNFVNEVSNKFLSIESNVEDNATLNTVLVDFGAKNSVSNYYSNVEGKEAISNIYSIYLADKDRLRDINYIANLYGQKTDVNIETQGALKDQAVKNFKGTIDFKRGCTKSKGNENEFCMLLSPRAKSRALPMLLCTEDDVEGNHSSASGKVDKKQLFYLMSRGFSQNEAMKLIVRAKFMPIIEQIDDEEIKEEILTYLDKVLA